MALILGSFINTFESLNISTKQYILKIVSSQKLIQLFQTSMVVVQNGDVFYEVMFIFIITINFKDSLNSRVVIFYQFLQHFNIIHSFNQPVVKETFQLVYLLIGLIILLLFHLQIRRLNLIDFLVRVFLNLTDEFVFVLINVEFLHDLQQCNIARLDQQFQTLLLLCWQMLLNSVQEMLLADHVNIVSLCFVQ